MSLGRCNGCGRRKVSDRQLNKWLRYVWRDGDYMRRVKGPTYGLYVGRPHLRAPLWMRLHRRQPLWFRFNYRCMEWYDCPDEYDPEHRLPLTRYERRCMAAVAPGADREDER